MDVQVIEEPPPGFCSDGLGAGPDGCPSDPVPPGFCEGGTSPD